MKKLTLISLCFLASGVVSIANAASNKCPWVDPDQLIPPMDGTLPCHLSGVGGGGSTILQMPGADGETVNFTLVLSANTDNTEVTNISVIYYTNCKMVNPKTGGTWDPVQVAPINLKPGESTKINVSSNCTYQWVSDNVGAPYLVAGSVNIAQPVQKAERFFTISKE